MDLMPDGAFSYTANSGASGQDSFNYEAVNTNGVSNPATVFVEIEAPLPIARDMRIVVSPGETLTFELDTENATRWSFGTDLNNAPNIAFATDVGVDENGLVTITVLETAIGEDRLIYTAENDQGDRDTGVVTFVLRDSDEEEPEVDEEIPEGALLVNPGRVLDNSFVDAWETDPFSKYEIVEAPSKGRLELILRDLGGGAVATTISYIASLGSQGTDSFVLLRDDSFNGETLETYDLFIVKDPYEGAWDFIAVADTDNQNDLCPNKQYQVSDAPGMQYNFSLETVYDPEAENYVMTLPNEWPATSIFNGGKNKTNTLTTANSVFDTRGAIDLETHNGALSFNRNFNTPQVESEGFVISLFLGNNQTEPSIWGFTSYREDLQKDSESVEPDTRKCRIHYDFNGSKRD